MEKVKAVTLIDIDMTDIYIKMRILLENSGYDELSSVEERNNLVLICFKKYLLEKLVCFQNIEIDESLSLLEIVELLCKHLPENYDQSKVDPIIFYLIYVISEYCGWYITWEQNANPKDNEITLK